MRDMQSKLLLKRMCHLHNINKFITAVQNFKLEKWDRQLIDMRKVLIHTSTSKKKNMYVYKQKTLK